MSFKLESVVPWGRRFSEYQAMFRLTDDDLRGRILGCGDGPASFNSEATTAGFSVTSVDPIYAFSTADVRSRIDLVFGEVVGQVSANATDFTWGKGINNLADLTEKRSSAMNEFLADFDRGHEQGRYLFGELPSLSFEDRSFSLALCSHFLFLYGEQLSTAFHIESLTELCRVANEVRVFPLLENGNSPSRHIDETRTRLDRRGIATEVITVDYEFQRGGNQMLVARAQE